MSLVDDLVASESARPPDMPLPSQLYKPSFTTNPDTISAYPACRFMRGPPPLLNTPSHLPFPARLYTSFSSELDVPATDKTRGSMTLSIGVYRAGQSWTEGPNSHHIVSANASKTEPARLIAYVIADDGVQATVYDK